LKQISEQVFVPGKSDHAIADVARGQNAIFAAQATGAAAVIGDRHDSGEVGNGLGRPAFAALGNVLFQAAQNGGKTRAAAERDHAD